MKKIWYLIGLCMAMVLLSGCKEKTVQTVSFDGFSMQRYTNDKTYIAEPTTDTSIIYQMKQQTTGTANSLMITKLSLASGVVIDEVAQANYDQLQKKLTKYQGDSPSRYDSTCNKTKLTGYDLSFSYTIETNTFWGYQYFLAEDTILYVISLHTNNYKDISAIEKSIETLTCN